MLDEIETANAKLHSVLGKIRHLAEFCESRSGTMNCKDCAADDAGKKNCLQYVKEGLSEVYSDIIEHIYAQESLMKLAPPGYHHSDHYLAHVEAHANISEQFHNVITSISHQSPADTIKQLLALMHDVLDSHHETFDREFLGMIRSPA